MQSPTESYFTKTTKMHEIVQYNYHLLTVINRFDIKLGFGNKTIDEICTKQKINPDFFVMIINLYCFNTYNPTKVEKILHYENSLEYLHKTNKYFIFVILIALQGIFNELKLESSCTQIILIQRFYDSILMELYNRNNFLERRHREYLSAEQNQLTTTDHTSEITIHNNEINCCLISIKNTLIRFYNGSSDENAIHTLFLIFRFEKELEISHKIELKTLSIYQNP